MKVFTSLVTMVKSAAADLVLALQDCNLAVSPHESNRDGGYYRFDVMDQGENVRQRISVAIVDAGLCGLIWENPHNPEHCPRCLGHSTQTNCVDNYGISMTAVCVNGHEYCFNID